MQRSPHASTCGLRPCENHARGRSAASLSDYRSGASSFSRLHHSCVCMPAVDKPKSWNAIVPMYLADSSGSDPVPAAFGLATMNTAANAM